MTTTITNVVKRHATSPQAAGDIGTHRAIGGKPNKPSLAVEHLRDPGQPTARQSVPPMPAPQARAAQDTASVGQTANRLHEHLHFAPQKALTLMGFVVSAILVFFFGADLATAWPFSRASVMFDVVYVVCGIGLAYVSHNAFRDLR